MQFRAALRSPAASQQRQRRCSLLARRTASLSCVYAFAPTVLTPSQASVSMRTASDLPRRRTWSSASLPKLAAHQQHRRPRAATRQFGNLAARHFAPWHFSDDSAPTSCPHATLHFSQVAATAPKTHAAWAAPWSLFLPHHRVRYLILFAASPRPAASLHQ